VRPAVLAMTTCIVATTTSTAGETAAGCRTGNFGLAQDDDSIPGAHALVVCRRALAVGNVADAHGTASDGQCANHGADGRPDDLMHHHATGHKATELTDGGESA